MKVLSGAKVKIQRLLRLTINEELIVENESGFDVEFEKVENMDGSKPSLTLKILRVVQKEQDPPRSVL